MPLLSRVWSCSDLVEGAAMLTDDAVLAMKKSLLSETHGKSHILYYSSETPVCT